MGVISYPIDGFHLGRTCQEALFATGQCALYSLIIALWMRNPIT